VIIAVMIVTVGLGYFVPKAIQEDGNDGFAPDAPELEASERISELFGDGTSGTSLQLIISSEDGDVMTAEGREAVGLITAAVRDSALADRLQVEDGQSSIISFLAPIEDAGAGGGTTARIVISSEAGDVITP